LHRIGIDERFDDSKLGNFKLSGTCPVGAKRNSLITRPLLHTTSQKEK